MASYCSSLVVVLLVLATFTTFTFSYPSFSPKITDQELTSICALSLRPSFCFSTLKHGYDKDKPTVDLHGLCEIAVRVSIWSAASTVVMLDELANGTTIHPELRKRYAACSRHFNDYIGTMNQANEMLKAGDAIGVNIAINGEGLIECKNEFKGSPVKDPSSVIPNGIADAYELEIIVIIIAGRVPY